MRRLSSSLALALAVAIPLAACGTKAADEQAAARADDVPVMSMDAVAVALAQGSCKAVDANGPQLRHDVGVLPGAVLLTDYEAFSLSELPDDKDASLVFYCANEQCDASHVAARRARSAGYQRVHVMAAGILGWSKAGHVVDKPALM